ncbi:hypothetical protein L1887_58721 [Cichorium endivia]|nr:hypothetical protein L1887_58721 [Cichorium endivia]
MSLENHSLNSSCESKSEGMIKWSSAQSSCTRVLHGRAREQQAVSAMKPSSVFHRILLDDLMACASSRINVLPLDALEVLFVRDDELIARDQDVERRIAVVRDLLAIPELAQHRAVLDIAQYGQSLERGHKLADLLLPVVQRGSGRNDEERAPDVVHLGEIGHERDRLHRFAETHLVGQDAVDACS